MTETQFTFRKDAEKRQEQWVNGKKTTNKIK